MDEAKNLSDAEGSPCTPSQVEAIFFAALSEATEAARADYLARACGGDAALRLQVERLLDAYPQAKDFLAQPAVDRHEYDSQDTVEDFTNVGPTCGPVKSLRDPAGDLASTVDMAGGAEPDLAAAGLPATIGRYRVIRPLGRGGFGTVYLAQDDALRRPVAIKVPNPERVAAPKDVAVYLAEAQVLAQLDHPNIVPVYDVGRTDDGLCFVVSKYVESTSLAERLEQGRMSFRESAELVATVALALHHAHTRDLVHRDIKPANILLASADVPVITDFGLALRDEDFGKEGRLVGTPAYMSPEQARGEGHLVDGRSDLFSLGAVFYELLTGRRPFRGDSNSEVMNQVATVEARPPRQIDDTIPRELERICQKALAKRASERYSTASDLAEDLRHFLHTEAAAGLSASPGPVNPPAGSTQDASSDARFKIIPKGLRSFDQHDAHFFLELLPGPRDRDGLPESLRFWKTRIESTDADSTFRVGLMYGPSGCGKSSLLKAGLLPRLSKEVLAVYIEATAAQTEARLLKGVRKAAPELSPGLNLVEALAALRRGGTLRPGQKVLLVLDQFEQWLFARQGQENTELVAALRQCDGEHLQAIVLVRDDFWLTASRFMRELEIDLEPNANIALVDLFDLQHARKVLTAFGRAYGKLPDRHRDWSPEQESFLSQAALGLAQGGRVVSVRLALFAEMVKGKPWTTAALEEVGGTEGVGVIFLEETFSSGQANPKHRLHQKAAQAVLKALLPQMGTDIRGQMRSEAELREASGYADRPRDFADLVRILDHELRLITPTEEGMRDEGWGTKGENSATDGSGSSLPDDSSLIPHPSSLPDDASPIPHPSSLIPHPSPVGYYQLTHDYLVHSLRDWLTKKQRETRRGRAELRLAERAALWNHKPENRHLPSLLEWANIRLLTRRKDWSQSQRLLMRRAARVHGLRGLGLAILIALVSWGSLLGYGSLQAAHLVDSLKTASIRDVPARIEQLRAYRRWAGRPLAGLLASTENDRDQHLRASLACLALWPREKSQAEYVYDRLLGSSPAELPVIWGILRKHDPAIEERLWALLDDAKADKEPRFRAACALASTDSAQIEGRWDRVSSFITDQFLAAAIKNPSDYATLIETLRPVRKALLSPLARVFRDGGRSEGDRNFATTILIDYASDDPHLLADLLMDAGAKTYASLFPVAQQQAAGVLPVLQAEIAKNWASAIEEGSEEAKDRLAKRQARAAIALVRLGNADQVWPLLRHSADPRLRSFIIHWLSPLGADPKAMVAELTADPSLARRASRSLFRESGSGRAGGASPLSSRAPDRGLTPPARPFTQQMDSTLFHPETSVRRALILALGTYGADTFSPADREPLIPRLLDLYRNDPDAGIHGSAEWVLRQWKQDDTLESADLEMSRLKDPGQRRWFVNSRRQTFVKIEGPVEFRMGSPENEPDRFYSETPDRRVISQRFAIAIKEVTVEQYQEFVKANPGVDHAQSDQHSPDPKGPMNPVNWYHAAAYCNWLSEEEGLPKDEWCYLPNEQKKYDKGMIIPADFLERTGYRLPSEVEWEYASRAGAVTSRHYGFSVDLLEQYARYDANSHRHAWPCGSLMPNDLGLFDTLGNVSEWCQERSTSPQQWQDASPMSDIVDDAPRMVRGGAFLFPPAYIRSAFRAWFAPSPLSPTYGFRLARTYN
jgi:serine/threonine protein kinase/formylglycine-generating enzyme required for sulfatase activity